MDTLTHALAGALIGELAARSHRAGESGLSTNTRRRLFIPLAIAGSNLPDMDFLYPLITGSKLDYLLHHRGHTHTIIGALIGSALMLLACEAWIRGRRLHPATQDRYWLGGLALLTPLLHIGMDSTNTYGVHPFWPFDNGWRYGDSVFIVEPLFWAAAVPLLFAQQARFARGFTLLLLLAAGAWIFSTGLIPLTFGVLLAGFTLAMLAVGYFASSPVALSTGVCAWAAITSMFILAHGIAESRVEAFVKERYPNAMAANHALSPMPVNPLCWEVILVQVEGDRYAIRRAMLSLAPRWIPAALCPNRRLNDPTTVPLAQVANADATYWTWHGEYVMPRDSLPRLAATRCEAAAFLRFARAPWAFVAEGRWILGDLRYDREPELSFSEIMLATDAHCPAHIPPWTAPLSVPWQLRNRQLRNLDGKR